MLKLIQELKEREISGTISSTVAGGLEKIQENGQGLFGLTVMLDGEGDHTNRSSCNSPGQSFSKSHSTSAMRH